MEHELYKAAYKGDIKLVQEITEQLNLIVTPMKNTVLHVNIAFSGRPSTKFVDQVLESCPPLLLQPNEYDETPLHVAAKEGVVAIVEVLIKHAKAQHEDLEAKETAVKQMLRMTNNDGNTALHEAAKNPNSTNVVKLLMSEDRDFPYYSANNYGETPLYVAAWIGFLKTVVELLKTCTSADYKGPHGTTILHAAVKRNHPEITRKILEKKSWTRKIDNNGWSLPRETDEYGWTPLYYAAYYNHFKIVKLLLEFDASAACIADKCRKMTPLHLAVGQGYLHTTNLIKFFCPACIEQVDNRGWNYIHFGICHVSSFTGRLRGSFWPMPNYLLNAKDVKGNTPLLVLASISPYSFDLIKKKIRREFIESTMHNIHSRGEQFHQLKNEVSELSKIRNEPYTRGVLYLNDRDFDQFCNSLEKEREMYLIVAALITTVTFTAGLTLPGGYIQEDSNKGTAVLIKNSAFRAFIIFDAIALVLSVLAVMFHIARQVCKLKKHLFLVFYAHMFTVWALGAMVIAFVTGTYAILRPSLGLAIVTVMIGLSWFLTYFYFVRKVRELRFRED